MLDLVLLFKLIKADIVLEFVIVTLNSEVKKLWVEALRSGKYNQSQNQLRTDAGFCCLGVLCHLGLEAGVNGEWEKRYASGSDSLELSIILHSKFLFSGARYNPPEEVSKWAFGLKDIKEEEAKEILDWYNKLSKLNDVGQKFITISEYIETQM